MIDPKSQRTLKALQAECREQVAKHLKREGVTHEVDTFKEEREALTKAAQDNPERAEEIYKIVNNPIMNKKSEVVDHVYTQELDRCLTVKIKQAQRDGRLRTPSKEEIREFRGV